MNPHVSLLLGLVAALGLRAADLAGGWRGVRGQWAPEREVQLAARQASPQGVGLALREGPARAHGAWRVAVAPSLGTKEAGVLAQGGPDLGRGFIAALGGGEAGGFALKTAAGRVLWLDQLAPWQPYGAYVVECIVERGRVRAQMLEWDGKTLVSQSPWVGVPADATESPGALGLYTRDGIARFWRGERGEQPLSPVTDDAPNKRRLVQGDDSPWTIVGPGNWMWTTGKKQRLRQYADIERSSAIHRGIRGALRKWECRVRVSPGAGGAGMLFQCNDRADQGFLAWLGGRFGDGSLMLYELPLAAKWSGKQGNWRYDTEYAIRAETRKGQARVQLLKADGETVIQDSSWVKIAGPGTAREGHIGFMTWKGKAEFWGFSEETMAAEAAAPAEPRPGQIGNGWRSHGGKWEWADGKRTRLRQTSEDKQALAVNANVAGIMGAWRCRAKAGAGTTAVGLVFQAGKDLRLGFASVLTREGAKLESLDGATLWQSEAAKLRRNTEYVLEGRVVIDRVSARVLAGDGKTVLVESPEVYVPDTNNERRGCLGVLARGGHAEFGAWELKP